MESVPLPTFYAKGHGDSPQRCLHLDVVVELVPLCDPESNAGGSLTTSRATHVGKVQTETPWSSRMGVGHGVNNPIL
jgi:hypothetical protein